MKKLLFISISLAILILTGCNNVDNILSNYSNIFSKNNEKTEQIKEEKVRDVINYCDVLYGNEEGKPPQIHERNLYEVLINDHGQTPVCMVENRLIDIRNLKKNAKRFINNNGVDPNLSDNPEKAIISLKLDKFTTDKTYIKVQNELAAAYNELRNEASFNKFGEGYSNLNKEQQKEIETMYTQKICEEWGPDFRNKVEPPPPPPPPPPPEVIEIVEDDWGIENEIEIYDTELEADEIIEIEEEDEDEFYMVVETMPEFPCLDFSFTDSEGLTYTKNYCGNLAIMRYIQKNVKYPPIAKEYNITGKVFVQFIVDKSGSVTNVKVVRGVDKNLDAEAVRVVRSLPKYKPGKQRGEPVRVMFTIPINFTLN